MGTAQNQGHTTRYRSGCWFGMAADFLESAAIESVRKEIEKGKHKFEKRRWARRSAVALHAGEQQREVPPSYFYDALTELGRTDVHPLDLVFLVSKDRAISLRLHSLEALMSRQCT